MIYYQIAVQGYLALFLTQKVTIFSKQIYTHKPSQCIIDNFIKQCTTEQSDTDLLYLDSDQEINYKILEVELIDNSSSHKHIWEFAGCSACPKSESGEGKDGCSQEVYECEECEAINYKIGEQKCKECDWKPEEICGICCNTYNKCICATEQGGYKR